MHLKIGSQGFKLRVFLILCNSVSRQAEMVWDFFISFLETQTLLEILEGTVLIKLANHLETLLYKFNQQLWSC